MATKFEKLIESLASEKHAVVGTSKLKATTCGHILNIKISKDYDNGAIVGQGDYKGMEIYAENTTVPTFTGVIREKAANGAWYVEVTDADGAFLLCNPELIYEEYSSALQSAYNFYNEKDSVVRGFELTKYDIFELSDEGFVGTPSKGATVSIDASTNKLAVA